MSALGGVPLGLDADGWYETRTFTTHEAIKVDHAEALAAVVRAARGLSHLHDELYKALAALDNREDSDGSTV